jgi:putative transposase
MREPKGWHSRGYLPHFDSPETVQFVTFRLADSLPRHVAKQLSESKEVAQLVERELDAGRGACWLQRDDIAQEVENTLLHFDAEHYRLLSWCIMPNHMHVLVELGEGHSLSDIVRRWKSFSARKRDIETDRSLLAR